MRNLRWIVATFVVFTGAFGAQRAAASMVLFEQSGLLSGGQTVVNPITLPGAGTLEVTLTDLAWPTRLQTLSFALSDTSHVLASLGAPGTQSFKVGAAGQLFAHVYGHSSGPLDAGLFSLSVKFTPVPLPSALVMLLAGIGIFAAARRSTLRELAPAAA